MKAARGFTYIEALIVIVITVLVAVLIMPNLVAQKLSRDEWVFRTDLRSLAKDARSRAIEVGRTVTLTFDKTKNQVQVLEIDANGSEQTTHTLPVPEWMTPARFLADQNEAVGDQWRVPFFGDGLSSGGGIQFKNGERVWSLVISPTDSTPKDLDGPLPDLSFETWPAGSNVPPSS